MFKFLLVTRSSTTAIQRRSAVDYLLSQGLGGKVLVEVAAIVTETLLAWHCEMIAQEYGGSAQRRPGRPRIREEIKGLVVRVSQENRSPGYCRIQGRIWRILDIRWCAKYEP